MVLRVEGGEQSNIEEASNRGGEEKGFAPKEGEKGHKSGILLCITLGDAGNLRR